MTTTDYRQAAAAFWPGPWVDLAYDAFDIINAELYAGELPPLPIMFGLTPHGGNLGSCSRASPPLITLHSSLIEPKSTDPWGVARRYWNPAQLVDVLTHEMIHAHLNIIGENPAHNYAPWCREVERQSPAVGVGAIVAAPWKRARDGNGLTYKPTKPDAIPRKALSTWPYLVRPEGYYEDRRPWYERR